MEKLDLLGASVAHIIFLLAILVFVSRLAGQPRIEYWVGLLLLLTALPLCYLLLKAPLYHRAPLYYLQLVLMLAYLVLEAVLDYVFKFDFRHVRAIVIPYVTLFFAATGGMIGVAALAGRPWAISSIILFLIMAVLAFVQHARLGL